MPIERLTCVSLGPSAAWAGSAPGARAGGGAAAGLALEHGLGGRRELGLRRKAVDDAELDQGGAVGGLAGGDGPDAEVGVVVAAEDDRAGAALVDPLDADAGPAQGVGGVGVDGEARGAGHVLVQGGAL